MARATWYVLEDGSAVDPAEVAPNANGRLAHKNGLVALRNDGETPHSRSVDLSAQPVKQTAESKPAPKPRQPKKTGYKTRGE